jgi:hypothetical protein
MTRFLDWEERLSAYVASVYDRPLVYGEHDCILYCASAAAAMTGEDVAAEYRGKYHDKAGAAAILRTLGAGTLLRTIDATVPRRSPALARRGDWVWHHGAVGLCMGREALFVGEERLADSAGVLMREGLITVSRALWSKAWAV